MQTSDSYLQELIAEERVPKLRLASVRAAMDVIVQDKIPSDRPDRQPGEASPPTLDGMRMRDAIGVYLAWRRDRSAPPLTLGELERELKRHQIMSFRKQPLAAMKHPWKAICNALGATGNCHLWHIKRIDPKHYTPLDTIELKSAREESNSS